MIIDELDLERVLFCGHTGVVVKATEACKRCAPRQQAMMFNKLLKAFHTDSHPQHSAILFISLVTREVHFKPDDSEKVNNDVSTMLGIQANYGVTNRYNVVYMEHL